jgi:hypothetical protein
MNLTTDEMKKPVAAEELGSCRFPSFAIRAGPRPVSVLFAEVSAGGGVRPASGCAGD